MNSQEAPKAGSQLLVEIIEAETIVYHQGTRQIHESAIYEAQPSNQGPAPTRIENGRTLAAWAQLRLPLVESKRVSLSVPTSGGSERAGPGEPRPGLGEPRPHADELRPGRAEQQQRAERDRQHIPHWQKCPKRKRQPAKLRGTWTE